MNEVLIYDMVADIKQNGANYIIIEIPQGGVGERYIDTEVVSNGIPYPLSSSGVTYTCKGTNGAGAAVMFDCELVNGKIRIPLISSIVDYSGIGKYRVEIYDTSGEDPILSTFSFNISIEKDPLDATHIIASDDYQTLKELIDRVEGSTSNWLIGHGAPSSSAGRDLDLYLDVDNGKVYKKTNGSWIYQGTLGNQTYYAYATDNQGSNFSTTYSGQPYLGICTGQYETQPLTPGSYTWIMISGGDNMRVADYGGSDAYTVAQADAIKGTVFIENIQVPANTSTPTTTVTVNNQNIKTTSFIRNVFTTINGLSHISENVTTGTLVLVFPALSTSATAVVEIYNPPEGE